MELADQERLLWNGVRSGCEHDLQQLYLLWYKDLIHYASVLSNDDQLCKENIDTLFVNLWRNRHKLPEVDSPRAYALTCYKRSILKQKQKLASSPCIYYREPGLLADESVGSDEDRFVECEEALIINYRIKGLISVLTERQRQIILLKYIHEWSYEKISAHLHLSLRTVYNSIHSSLKLMRSPSNKISKDRHSIHSLN